MKPSQFFLRVWRWHFYAGLFALPFLFILACTGIVYLFRFELEDVIYRDRIVVESSPTSLSLDEQREAAARALEGSSLKRVTPPTSPDRSTAFLFTTPGGEDVTVFVRPADGVVLGTRNEASRPSAIALKIHGELLAGKTGDFLMELAASWTILLVASGLYLWFPRGTASKVWGVVLPRLSQSGGRMPWRDIHAVSGFWVAGVLAFFAFTGLFWSGIWGEKIAKPWSTFPARMWDDIPKSGALNASLNSDDSKVVPWAVENLPVPTSRTDVAVKQNDKEGAGKSEGSGHAGHSSDHVTTEPTSVQGLVGLDKVQIVADEKGILPDRTISLPTEPKGVYTVTANALSSTDEALLHIDQFSGAVLAEVRFADYSPAAKAVATSIALHEGRQFGLFNKLLAFVGCMLVNVLCVSAAVLWWRRRPNARNLRAPSRVSLPRHWLGASVLVCVFAVAFPTAGVSLIAVLLLDAFILRRVSVLKHMF